EEENELVRTKEHGLFRSPLDERPKPGEPAGLSRQFAAGGECTRQAGRGKADRGGGAANISRLERGTFRNVRPSVEPAAQERCLRRPVWRGVVACRTLPHLPPTPQATANPAAGWRGSSRFSGHWPGSCPGR